MEELLSEAGNLLTAIRPASPLGLILYEKQRVIENIEAGQDENNRKRILRALLERATTTSAPASLERGTIRPYANLVRETNALIESQSAAARTEAYWERFSSFANLILPFYQRAESKYFERLGGQGAFKAFEIICTLPEPALVIVISDGETNLDGLAEGAKNARALKHQVILMTLEPAKGIEMFSDLEDHGVDIWRCRPEDLSRAINAAILKLSHTRTIPLEPAR